MVGGRLCVKMTGTSSRKPNMVTCRSPSCGRLLPSSAAARWSTKRITKSPTTAQYRGGRLAAQQDRRCLQTRGGHRAILLRWRAEPGAGQAALEASLSGSVCGLAVSTRGATGTDVTFRSSCAGSDYGRLMTGIDIAVCIVSQHAPILSCHA